LSEEFNGNEPGWLTPTILLACAAVLIVVPIVVALFQRAFVWQVGISGAIILAVVIIVLVG